MAASAGRVVLEGFPHLAGTHCSSSALRSVLAYDGIALSEAMVFGLGSGLGFFYRIEPDGSPTRRFNGRAPDLEGSFYRRMGAPVRWAGTWSPEAIAEALAAGRPVLAKTDVHPIPYYDDAHFTGHGLVVVGIDGRDVMVADIASDELSRMTLEEFRRAVAVDHPPLLEPYGYAPAPTLARVDVLAAAPAAVAATVAYLIDPPSSDEGLPALRRMAADLPEWAGVEDVSWCARFGYQTIEKRGTGGGNFRSLYAEFLDELASLGLRLPAAAELRKSAREWSAAAAALKAAAFEGDGRALRGHLCEAGEHVARAADIEEAALTRLGEAAEAA